MTKAEEQSALLKDISNFKTPKRPPKTPGFKSPYTASVFRTARQTPGSASASVAALSRRRQSVIPSAARSKAVRRLKEIELEQTQSSRKAEVKKERSLKSLSTSLTAWLNFLFENPRGCGCERWEGDVRNENGKRDGMDCGGGGGGGGVGVDEEWRNPKRLRDYEWSTVNVGGGEMANGKMFSALRDSLKEVCSFDDLLLRMRAYLSLDSCKEIYNIMTKVTKAIDEGRLKMKAHCPIVTDFGMKEKATQILLCYNPTWLKIGLHIIFGGDYLLSDSEDQENGLLQMVIERQFFSHAGLAKVYAYNKNVEGVYRPGYFEELGSVILKRFLLLVLILDRAKSQRTLPLKFGIDGIDGGSPLLFTVDCDVKASHQMVNEFLSTNVMHGEGNLLAHLEMVRYKLAYQQEPLLEYCFRVSDLFEDLQDGVLISRAIQLLQHDSSILLGLAVPSDTHKKKVINCSVVLQYLKQARIPLHDDDGVSIIAEDIAQGDKELTVSLLWNIFVHLQMPLLIKKPLFLEEIYKIRGTVDDKFTFAVGDPLALLLSWVQVVCDKYGCQVNNFTSFVDGKVMRCLLDYYFRKELCCSCAYKDLGDQTVAESIVSASEYTDGVHNFILSQKLTTLLGNFPEVLKISDLLEYNDVCNERCVMILLVFLSSELIVKRNMDQLNFHKLLGCACRTVNRKRSSPEQLCPAKYSPIHSLTSEDNDDFARNFRAIKAWWQDITQQNHKREYRIDFNMENDENTTTRRENAVRVIQSFLKQFIARKKYLKIKGTASFLLMAVRAWLAAKTNYSRSCTSHGTFRTTYETLKASEKFQSYSLFMDERHKFIMLKRSALLIQRAVRMWIRHRHCRASEFRIWVVQGDAVIIIQRQVRRWLARKLFLRENKTHCDEIHAITVIQSHVRRLLARKRIAHEKETLHDGVRAITVIQSHVRKWLARRIFSLKKETLLDEIHAITVIQSHVRRWLARKRFSHTLHDEIHAVTVIQSQVRRWLARRRFSHKKKTLRDEIHAITVIQSHVRRWLARRRFSHKKKTLRDEIHAITVIQKNFRRFTTHKVEQVKLTLKAAIIIQSQFRRWIVQQEYQRQRHLIIIIQSHIRVWLIRRMFSLKRKSAVKIQSLWRAHKMRVMYSCYKRAVTTIQCVVRGQITRKRLLGSSDHLRASFKLGTTESSSVPSRSFELDVIIRSILKLQRWWRDILLRRLKNDSAIIIQAHVCGWLARRHIAIERSQIVYIQSHWRGYLARKGSKQDLVDLRLRVKKSATNIDDSKRLMNRLLTALSELLSMKSVRNILHTCETLDTATKHSQKCCEELVAAGAVDTLLKLIQSVSRSIPDQEVLKYALSTLRNLARYPHLIKSIISANRSVEVILFEVLRNKEDAYFTAAELMKKICSVPEGIKALHSQPGYRKRLHSHVDDLKRRISIEKRNPRANLALKVAMEKRLLEGLEILKIATTGR